MPILRDVQLSISLDAILSVQGIGNPSMAPQKILDLSRELITLVTDLHLLEPAIAYEFYPVYEVGEGFFLLEGGLSLRGRLLVKRLNSALELSAVVCTIGPRLEEQVSEFSSRADPLRGIMLDGLGSAAVESLAQEACKIIREQAGLRGYETSSPLSPGMLDFPLSEQWAICKIVHAEQIRVSLTQTAMMVPRKSTSMVMGIGLRMPTWTKAEACKTCPLRHTCRFRVHV